MIGITKLGKIINPEDFEKFIEASKSLETVVHKYGQHFSIPEYPCWMEYRNEGNVNGSISFSRHTHKHPVLHEMTQKVVDILSDLFPVDIKPMIERVHFLKTRGSIVKHRDEAGRLSCINIGLMNSDSAITKISNDDVFMNFENNHTDYNIEDGVAYLLDTHRLHAVSGNPNIDRYLITYGFDKPFDEIKSKLRIK